MKIFIDDIVFNLFEVGKRYYIHTSHDEWGDTEYIGTVLGRSDNHLKLETESIDGVKVEKEINRFVTMHEIDVIEKL